MVGPGTERRLSLTSATDSDSSLLGKVSAVGEATRVVLNTSLLVCFSLRRKMRPHRYRDGPQPSGGGQELDRAGGGVGKDFGPSPWCWNGIREQDVERKSRSPREHRALAVRQLATNATDSTLDQSLEVESSGTSTTGGTTSSEAVTGVEGKPENNDERA